MKALPFLFFLGLGLGAPSPVSASDTGFWLRNSDPSQLFLWWSVPNSAPGQALGSLSGSSGRHPVAPGERVRVVLPGGSDLLGVFVPWQEGAGATTPLTGGWLLAGEVPAQGTVLVDSPSWKASNRGRSFSATLQEWGIEPPGLVLDGRSEDWARWPSLNEWGPAFVPAQGEFPARAPRPVRLQAADRDGALWLRWELAAPPPASEASLVLEAGSLTLEWPVPAQTGTVWAWEDGQAAAVGQVVRNGTVCEAWLPWDRLTPAQRQAWTKPGRWSWLVTTPRPQSYELGPFSAQDLP